MREAILLYCVNLVIELLYYRHVAFAMDILSPRICVL